MFMKLPHSFKGMENYISVYVLCSPKRLWIQCPEKSKIPALENILRFRACSFDISENTLFVYLWWEVVGNF